MNLGDITKADPWAFYALINGVSISSIHYFAKNKLQDFLGSSWSILLLTLCLIRYIVAGNLPLIIMTGGTAYTIFRNTYQKKLYKIKKEDISWRPIFITCLFICSYILGIVMLHFNMPWFIGYLLPMFCFLLGLIIYKKAKPA
jgi:hypothetical protein